MGRSSLLLFTLAGFWLAVAACSSESDRAAAAADKADKGANACHGHVNECGACWPSIPRIGGECTAANGCPGARTCAADGKGAECTTNISVNACGACNGPALPDLGAECMVDTLGVKGMRICAPSGDRTVCSATVVTLTFDDTFADSFPAGALLESHGMRATYFVNSPRLTRTGGGGGKYMTIDQVRDLEKRGHEIGGHTLDHVHLPALSRESQLVEICNDRASLIELGLDVRHLAYPFGESDAQTEEVARLCNYNSARGVGNLRDAASGRAIAGEAFAPPRLFSIRADTSIGDKDTLAAMQQRVLRAEKAGGGWVIVNMHHVCDTCGAAQVHPDILRSFVEWLEPRSTTHATHVRTMKQVLPGDRKSAVVARGVVVVPPVPDAGIEE